MRRFITFGYAAFGSGVILLYITASLMGWEFANGGRKSFLAMPFASSGFRGGK